MTLEELRQQIDLIDDQLIKLLEERFAIVEQLPPYKNSMTDDNREQQILSKISSPPVKDVYRSIFINAKKMMYDQ